MIRLARLRPVAAVLASGIVVVALALMLAGCGKKGTPQPPPGQPVTYPRNYPSE
jgi:predicted small lipoprotein YifL